MANEFIEVKWEVADGYAGKSRPQYTRICIADIMDCDCEQEVKTLIDDAIEEDFLRKICTDYGESVYEDALSLFAEKEADND